MLRKPETDDRVKARLFIVIKNITESDYEHSIER